MAPTRSFHITLSALLVALVLATSVTARIVPEKRAEAAPHIEGGHQWSTRKHQTRHLRADDGHPLNDLFPRATPDDGGIQAYDPKVGPQRGEKGAPFYQKDNEAIGRQNPDGVARPPTDNGVVPTLKWSISLASTRLLKGGFVREQLVQDLPVSKDIAAAELALKPWASREGHWHRVAEWAYVLHGSGRLSVLDEYGKNYNSNIEVGDVWYFPKGSGHAFQAFEKGLEILVVFADGNFEATGTTFMLSDWLIHTPKEVLAQNFGVSPRVFDSLPAAFPYIYPSTKEPKKDGSENEISPDGEAKNPFVYKLSKAKAQKGKGGWLKIADSTNFPASTEIASALVHIEPGALRELHWHPLADEWIYIIQGEARITAFQGGAAARTFNFRVGDTGVLPSNYGHFVKAVGNEPLVFLEIYKAPRVSDISATQWLALTPHQQIADLLNVSKSFVDDLPKGRQLFVQ